MALLTVDEAALQLGTSPRFVRRLIAERRIAFAKLGKHVRLDSSDLDAFIDGAVQEAMLAEKGIHLNLDFPTGPAYYLMGFDIPIFTPLFVLSRITGWTAHIIEQQNSNSVIRPLSKYVGPDERSAPARRMEFGSAARSA